MALDGRMDGRKEGGRRGKEKQWLEEKERKVAKGIFLFDFPASRPPIHI